MRKQKFIVCYLVIFLMSFFISGCSSQEKEELTLVTEAGFAPYEYYSNGEIVGVDIEIAQKIAKNLGKKLVINAGYSHPVEMEVPEGLTVESVSNTEITVKGINKMLVGEFAANIRKVRQPEPYKGKGIRYKDEHIRRKEGKKAA